MNKEEALEKIEELKMYVEDLDKTEDILVPDNIRIGIDTSIYSKGIFFSSKQELDVQLRTGDYRINLEGGPSDSKFKLVPCKREDLELGDLAFRGDSGDRKNLHYYCIILDYKSSVCVENNRAITISTKKYDKWYRIEEV